MVEHGDQPQTARLVRITVEPVGTVEPTHPQDVAKRNLGQLAALVKTRLKRMQYRPGLIDGFLAKTGLDLTPS